MEVKDDKLPIPGFLPEGVEQQIPDGMKKPADNPNPSSSGTPWNPGNPIEDPQKEDKPGDKDGVSQPDAVVGSGQSPDGEADPDPIKSVLEELNSHLGIKEEEGDKSNILDELRKHGYDLKSVDDLDVVLKDLDTYKSKTEEYSQKVDELLALENFISTMPDDLYNIVDAYYSGSDYKKFLNMPKGIDFTKPFSEQSEKEIINYYYPGKFSSDEDYQEFKDSNIYNEFVDAVKGRYEAERIKVNKEQNAITNKLTGQAKALRDSAIESISHVQKMMPEVGNDVVDKIRHKVSGNINEFVSEFIEDGKWKSDAAVKIAKMYAYDDMVAKSKALLAKSQEALAKLIGGAKGGRQRIPEPGNEDSKELIKNFMKSFAPSNNENPFK